MSNDAQDLPWWVGILLIPLVNLLMAFIIAGLVIWAIGEDPFRAISFLILGAFGYADALGYTLYYATNFIFTGLAVAIAFHAGLFNIGGEGQAYIGGLGAGLACLALDSFLPAPLLIPVAVLAAAAFGAGWAYIPAYLQAYRGSHIVITTIMFNFIAASLMVYLLVNILIEPGQMSPETRDFSESAWIPAVHDVAEAMGLNIARSPLNFSLLWALICCWLVWLLLWRTRLGYAIRAVGANEVAAIYGGIRPQTVIIVTMCISGGLAGFVATNEILGLQHRLLLEFAAGYGFGGIAVALMGRNHPVGIIFASVLFGALYQGGAELAFEMPSINREIVVMIQGLVILFFGALEHMFRPQIEAWVRARQAGNNAVKA